MDRRRAETPKAVHKLPLGGVRGKKCDEGLVMFFGFYTE